MGPFAIQRNPHIAMYEPSPAQTPQRFCKWILLTSISLPKSAQIHQKKNIALSANPPLLRNLKVSEFCYTSLSTEIH